MKHQHPRPDDAVEPPAFWKTGRAFLKWTIAFVLIGSAAFAIGIFMFVPDQIARTFGPASMSLAAAIAWVLLARGRNKAAVQALAFGVWAAVVGIAFFTGGGRGWAIVVFPQLILMLGWLIGARAAIAMGVLAVATTFVFALAESRGFLPPLPPTPPIMGWIVQIAVLAFSVVMIAYFLRAYQNRLNDAVQLSDDLAMRIDERRLAEAREHQRQEELLSIYRLSEAVGTADTVESVYRAAIESILQLLDADRVSILLFDADGVMRFKAWHGLSEAYRVAAEGHSPWTADTANPQPIFVDDGEHEPTLAHLRPAFAAEGLHAFGFIPLVQRDRLLGNFMVYFNLPHKFSENESRLLRTIAFHVAVAIERMQSHAALRQSEARVRNLNRELEQRVAERTQALEVANKELEAFSYSVSHDLRAPLRAIQGFSGLVEQQYASQIDDAGRDMLRRVGAGAQKMALLIDDLLKLSRISRQEMRIGRVDLSALAREAADDLEGAEPERRAEWTIAPQVSVEGDPGLLRVMLQNLIGNAWKYSSRRDLARIEFGVGEQDGHRVYFVRDNGAGFDMAYAGKLFGAFQRLHSATEFPGSGIGLATVARIIHRHGGTVWAEGREGDGATFYFSLTADSARQDPQNPI